MKNSFSSLHPFVTFLFFLASILAIMLYQHPFFQIFSCIILIIFNFILDRGQTLKSYFPIMLILSIFIFVFTPLLNHRGNHILFTLFENGITLESVILGTMNALMIFSIFALFITFNIIITPDKFLFLFSKYLPQWALLMMLSLRFVLLLRRRLHEIIQVQKVRGISISEGWLTTRIKNGLLLVQILLTWSLEEGIQTADSMSARGYGLQKRSRYIPYKMTNSDYVIVSVIGVQTVCIIFGWYLGDGVLQLLPVLEPVLLYGREWFYFVIYVSLISLPLLIEAREAIKWQLWKQKI